MMTPDGRTKVKINEMLLAAGIVPAAKAGAGLDGVGWYFMPVQTPYGIKGVPDYIGHLHGRFFAIEAKALGKTPTGLQALQLAEIHDTGGTQFVVDGSRKSLIALREWLTEVRAAHREG
jgi:hypothetical protein